MQAESHPLDTSQVCVIDAKSYRLDVSVLNEGSLTCAVTMYSTELGHFQGTFSFYSAYLDESQLVELLQGQRKEFGDGVHASFQILQQNRGNLQKASHLPTTGVTQTITANGFGEVSDDGNVQPHGSQILKVTLRVSVFFQRNPRTKQVKEEHNFDLYPTSLKSYLKRIQVLEDRNDRLERELSVLSKRYRAAATTTYDSLARPLKYQIYFHAKEIVQESYYEITIAISQENKDFLDFLATQERYTKISELNGWSGLQFKSFISWGTNTPSQFEISLLRDWIIDLCPGSGIFCLKKKCPSDVKEYLVRRRELVGKMYDTKIAVDDILITLFELNLEYELRDTLLLYPTLVEPRFQCMDKLGVQNKFNILQMLDTRISRDDGISYNPRIGFYRSEVE